MAPVNQLEFSPCCYVAPKSPPLIPPYSCQCLALPAPRVPPSARTPAYTCQRRPVHEPRTMPRTRQSALSIPATSAWALGSPRGAVIIAQAVRWPLVLPRAKVRSPTACVNAARSPGGREGGGLARSGGGGLPGTEQRRQQQAATAAHPPMRRSSGREEASATTAAKAQMATAPALGPPPPGPSAAPIGGAWQHQAVPSSDPFAACAVSAAPSMGGVSSGGPLHSPLTRCRQPRATGTAALAGPCPRSTWAEWAAATA